MSQQCDWCPLSHYSLFSIYFKDRFLLGRSLSSPLIPAPPHVLCWHHLTNVLDWHTADRAWVLSQRLLSHHSDEVLEAWQSCSCLIFCYLFVLGFFFPLKKNLMALTCVSEQKFGGYDSRCKFVMILEFVKVLQTFSWLWSNVECVSLVA